VKEIEEEEEEEVTTKKISMTSRVLMYNFELYYIDHQLASSRFRRICFCPRRHWIDFHREGSKLIGGSNLRPFGHRSVAFPERGCYTMSQALKG